MAVPLQKLNIRPGTSAGLSKGDLQDRPSQRSLAAKTAEQLPIITFRALGSESDRKPQFVISVSEDVRGAAYPHFVRIPLQKQLPRGRSAAAPAIGRFHLEGKGMLKVQGTLSPVMSAVAMNQGESRLDRASTKVAWAPVPCSMCSCSPCICRKSAKVSPRVTLKQPRQPIRVQTAPTISIEPVSASSHAEGASESGSNSPAEERFSPMPEDSAEPAEKQIVGEKTWLVMPLFRGRPHTVLFDYPPQCCLPSRVGPRVIRMSLSDEESKPLYYRFSAHVYSCVAAALEFNGFRLTSTSRFNLFISGSIRPKILLDMDEYQKYNHYPGSWQLGRKDNLWRNVSKMKRVFGEEYAFCPATYLLPEDYDRFVREREEHPKQLWIYKPAASACGRGIKVLSNKSKIRKKHGYLISSYVSNPHLMNGLKYDLRLYVCVTCYDPLRIYLYQEGLVRFATSAYTTSKKSVEQRYVHLTNYSVNKRAANYQFNQQSLADNQGNKWSHTALKKAFASMGIDPEVIFAKVKDVIVKTIIAAEPLLVNSVVQYAKCRGNCFEVYGFDVLLDEALRPWLMEVNVSPSLNSGSPLDKRIKTALMADIYTLVGFTPYDRKKCGENSEAKKQERMYGIKKVKKRRTTLSTVKACQRLEELELAEEEIEMLMETEEEYWRSGNFERLFPTKESIAIYSRFIQTDRLNNLLTWKLLQDDSAYLKRFLESPPLVRL